MSKKRSRYPSDRKVYIGDLGNSARKNELEYAFGAYGPLRSVWIARSPPGFAFVEFEDARDAADAVKGLDGRTICGRRARVELSTGKSAKAASGGGGGGCGGCRSGGGNRRGGGDRYGRSGGRGIGGGRNGGGIVITVISSFATNFWTLFILRYLNGFCISGGSATVYVYLGEFHMQKNCSRAIMGAAFIFGIGAMLMPAIAWLFINQECRLPIPFLA